SAGRIVGLYTIPLVLLCTVCSFMVKILFQPTVRSAVAFSFVCTLIILTMDFFFQYILTGYSGVLLRFVKTVLLSTCYSMIFSVLYYKIISAIQKRFVKFNAR
ncbi:MAG: hypothetical protein IIV99_02625, partial [Oscillospiraceae bacterium]|nr:hypothetical protein [Oscillospiraceae bacterium]